MGKYHFVFLLNEEVELKNIKELVKSYAGKVVKEEAWGQKTLAYPIKKQLSANFYDWQIELGQKDVSEFKRKLNFNEKLLRYLLLKTEN